MKLTSAIAVLAAIVAFASAATHAPTAGQDLCCAANKERVQRGIPALKWSPAIDAAAQRQSEYQRSLGRYSHFGPPGKLYELAGRLEAVGFGFRTAAENVGSGFKNVDSITTRWMNSDGHRAHMLGRGSTVCGGGLANAGGFYTINLASPMNPSDANGFYTLQCSGSKSLGAYTGNSPVTPVQPPVQPPVAPKPPMMPANPGNGKCKLVPKGSIAAGKCKPCKQCGPKASPFRR
ncbi:hypothetical protein GGF42_005483 [Coemansia sp. RSA 2424]|nr:hypothetical protein GGF42_005483 [Coemansia sp. RSA 2424]